MHANVVPFCQSCTPLYPITVIQGAGFCGSVQVDVRTFLISSYIREN